MDRDGVAGELVYPTIGMGMFGIQNREMSWAFMRAYNEWVSEFCAPASDRLKGVGLLAPDNVDRAVTELSYIKELGLVAGMLPLDRDDEEILIGSEFDPVWSTAQELGLSIHFHIATPRSGEINRPHAADQVIEPVTVQHVLARLIFGGVFERFPGLQVVSAENDASWVGDFLERADYVFHRRRDRAHQMLNTRTPSETVASQLWFTFTHDICAPAVAELEPVRLIWGSDYPHISSTWPNSIKVIDEHFVDKPEELRRASVYENAARLYGFPPFAA
jgi:predicted TIM-barrel fold metal-dependent hydrolase